MPHLSVLVRDTTVPFASYMILAYLEHSTFRAASISFPDEFFLRIALFMVRKKCLAPKVSDTFSAGYSDGRKDSQRTSHTVAFRLVTDACDITSA